MRSRVAAALAMVLAMAALAGTAQADDGYVLDRGKVGDGSEAQVFTDVPAETQKGWVGQVDLFGIGGFLVNRKEVTKQFEKFVPDEGSINFLIRLGFKQGPDFGRTISCNVLATHGNLPADAKDRMCKALRSGELQRMTTLSGFDWGAANGYQTIELALYKAPALQRPFVQAKGRDGIGIDAIRPMITSTAPGTPTCVVIDQRVAWNEYQAVCDIYQAQMVRSDWVASDGKEFSEWEKGKIYLERDPDPANTHLMIDMTQIGPSGYNQPKYDPVKLKSDLELTDAMGKLRLSTEGFEYPQRAKETDVRGKTTIILWPKTDSGARQRCRVEISSGSSVLDNAACELAMRRALWRWADGVTPFAGGWRRVAVDWSLLASHDRPEAP